MKNFAHWKNIQINQGEVSPGLSEVASRSIQRNVPGQTGPGNGPIQFVVEIPDEATRDEVIAAYLPKFLQSGNRIDETLDGMGFEQEWPPDVRSSFHSGEGERKQWSSL
jgi:hypothetical protein